MQYSIFANVPDHQLDGVKQLTATRLKALVLSHTLLARVKIIIPSGVNDETGLVTTRQAFLMPSKSESRYRLSAKPIR